MSIFNADSSATHVALLTLIASAFSTPVLRGHSRRLFEGALSEESAFTWQVQRVGCRHGHRTAHRAEFPRAGDVGLNSTPRALARDTHDRLRQPRATVGRRAQGRWSPGLVGLDGDGDDCALFPLVEGRRSRGRQATRLAGAAFDQLPARASRSRLPDEAPRFWWSAGVSLAHEGPRSDRFLDWVRWSWCRCTSFRQRRRSLRGCPLRCPTRPSVRGAARRCRARRGQRLGGVGRSGRSRARAVDLDRRFQSSEPRSRDSWCALAGIYPRLPRPRLAGRDRQVRVAAARGLRLAWR